MTDCCHATGCAVEQLRQRQQATLKVVLLINAGMFMIEIVAGLMAASTALLADSLDMLGDALVYGFSLYVVARDERWKARSALIKGGVMALFGVFVLTQAGYKLIYPVTPQVQTIGIIGLLALCANAACLALLWRHRAEDINMRSVWLCSRNDIIANIAVLLTIPAVWLTHSQWPDLAIGLAIAALFLRSACVIMHEAWAVQRAVLTRHG